MNREGRSWLYVMLIGWIFFGIIGVVVLWGLGATAWAGEESFEEEDIPLTEQWTYLLPGYDLTLSDFELYLSYFQLVDGEDFDDAINL